jgi:acetylglutamate kinase
VEVNGGPLIALLEHGYVPIVAPLGVAADASTALNVNADTAAGAIAGALRADAYIVVTNVDRVRLRVDDPATGITSLDTEEAERYLATGVFDGGMRPKMQSAIDALASGARRALICGTGPQAITRALSGQATALLRACLDIGQVYNRGAVGSSVSTHPTMGCTHDQRSSERWQRCFKSRV